MLLFSGLSFGLWILVVSALKISIDHREQASACTNSEGDLVSLLSIILALIAVCSILGQLE